MPKYKYRSGKRQLRLSLKKTGRIGWTNKGRFKIR